MHCFNQRLYSFVPVLYYVAYKCIHVHVAAVVVLRL